MKVFLCFVFMVHFYLCAAQYSSSYYNEKWKEDEHDNEIKRPCPKKSLECIRPILSEILRCKPVHGLKSDHYIYDNHLLNLPNANTTFIWQNAIVSGFRMFKINEFYINEKTKTLVFEVEFKAISLRSPKSTIFFYRKGKEPIVRSDYANILYKDLSLTLTISNIYGHKPDYHVFTFINDKFPPIDVGPEFAPEDIDGKAQYAQLTILLPVTLKETFVTQGPAFFSLFLKTAICE